MAPLGVTPEAPVQSEHAIDEGRATAMMTAVRRLMSMTGTAPTADLACTRYVDGVCAFVAILHSPWRRADGTAKAKTCST